MRYFDPSDLVQPVGIHDRHVREDGQGAALWLRGLHVEGVAIGFQARSLVDRPPGPTDPEPPELRLPRMTVIEDGQFDRMPALRGHVSSVDGRMFKLDGVYYVRVSDPDRSVRCSVTMHGNALAIEFAITGLM